MSILCFSAKDKEKLVQFEGALEIQSFIVSLLRPVSLRAIEIDTVHADAFGSARVAIESEIDDAAVVAFAQLVSFVGDSSGQGVFRVWVEATS